MSLLRLDSYMLALNKAEGITSGLTESMSPSVFPDQVYERVGHCSEFLGDINLD